MAKMTEICTALIISAALAAAPSIAASLVTFIFGDKSTEIQRLSFDDQIISRRSRNRKAKIGEQIQRLSFDDQIISRRPRNRKAKIGEQVGLGSNDYVSNFLQPFLADGQQYTHDEFVGLLISTLGEQLTPTRLHPVQEGKIKPSTMPKASQSVVQQFNSKVQKLLANLNRSDAANEVLAEKLFAELFSHAPSAAPLASP
ncbi:unnamed protein product [Fraxinus pennsylvanica]|uniref:Uncharacterized protein n=1 Tax=Fraxinus pennsylvanica TaxID=56036 RepID=A0AAD1YLW9_9LAMI|nr:unnamed protein product [Fraxinus pennsylvanica]